MQTNPNIDQVYEYLAHNTAVQILCSTGIIGTILFSYHIFEVVKFIIKNRTIEIFVITFAILVFMVISMVDQFFFVPNFTIIYTFLLVFMEKETA
jgi:O-antigen ligase